MLAVRARWHQGKLRVSPFPLQVAGCAKEPIHLRHLCHPAKVVQTRTNSISVWKAIYKPVFSGMTLLIRLGEGWGRERCSFHKTVDMHFSERCFSFTPCWKRLLDKAEIWVSLQQGRKKEKALSMLPTGPLSWFRPTWHLVALLPCVLRAATGAQALSERLWLICPLGLCCRDVSEDTHNLSLISPCSGASHGSHSHMSLCPKRSMQCFILGSPKTYGCPALTAHMIAKLIFVSEV